MSPLPPPPPAEEDFYQTPSALPMPAPPEDMYQTPPPPVEGQSWIPEDYIEKGLPCFTLFYVVGSNPRLDQVMLAVCSTSASVKMIA